MEFHIGNIYTKAVPANDSERQFMTNILSVKDPSAYYNPSFQRGQWDGYFRFYNPYKNIFGTGLLPIAVRECENCGIRFQIFDERGETVEKIVSALRSDEVTEGYEITEGRFARDYQADAYNSVAYNTIMGIPFPRGCVNIATNGGKTSVAIMLIQHTLPVISNDKPFLFLVHSKEIAIQAAADIARAIGEDVGFLMAGKPYKGERVLVGTQAFLASKIKRKDKRYLHVLESAVGCVCDECHRSQSDTFQAIMDSMPNAVVRVGMTGTIPTDKVKAFKVFRVTGEVLTKISNAKLISKGVSAKPAVFLYKIDERMFFDRDNADGLTIYQAALDDLVIHCDRRNYVIARICEKEVREGRHVLILVERLEHGANIVKAILKYASNFSLNGENGHSVFFTNGQETMQNREKSLEELRLGHLDVLVSTAILDEGVDVSGIDAVIYARSGVSKRKLLQGLGRGIRKKENGGLLHIYDFLDMGERHLRKHSEQRFKTYQGEGFWIKLVDDNDIENSPFSKLEPPEEFYEEKRQ